MINWNILINQSTVATVLPSEYAQYARPVSDALVLFLNGLPTARQSTIFEEQANLPPTTTTSERISLLARGCPALQKLGQVIARDQSILPELRRHLQELESLPPSVPMETIKTELANELGSLESLGISLAENPIAEASVAVVIPFHSSNQTTEGVFKILKPEIEERLDEDLASFEQIGAYLDQRCDELHIPKFDYQEAFEQVRDKLRHEVRLDLEQHNLTAAKGFYAHEPQVQIPAVLDHCTPRVTAMERVMGVKITDHDRTCLATKSHIAELVSKALIADPVFRKASPSVFHADPHAGNLFLTPDNRLAILDWSLIGSLGERERVCMTQVLLGTLTRNPIRIRTALQGLGDQDRLDRAALGEIVSKCLNETKPGSFPGFARVMGMIDQAVRQAKLRVGADLLLFRKTTFTLNGVLADIGSGENPTNKVLLREFVEHFARELPNRWFALPNSRDFATRLSNMDITELLLSVPWTAMEFWLEGLGGSEH
ncbi:MAG: AarF/UbiB family protein [Gemmataceae bacterium]